MSGTTRRALVEKLLPAIEQAAGKRVAPESVEIRGAVVCNTRLDHYYTRFTHEALGEVADLLPGRPLMVGHDYRGLPIGRFFQAERAFVDSPALAKADSYVVRGLFYVERSDQADAMLRRIDTGLYREVSLGWRCNKVSCSICGGDLSDMEQCSHAPGEVYGKGVCAGLFSGITSVLEASLVFAGGQVDTQTFDPAVEARLLPGNTFEEWFKQ